MNADIGRQIFDSLESKKEVTFKDLEGDTLEWNNAIVMFSNDSFQKEYPIDNRTYLISHDANHFHARISNSIWGTSLDGIDVGVKLSEYMFCQNPWKIEGVWVISDEDAAHLSSSVW